jgi:hypothetical protein
MMDFQQLFMALLGVCCIVLGWFSRTLYDATQSLRKDLSVLEIQLNREYVRYDRLADAFKPVMESLQEIKQTLAGKADK